MLLEGEKLKALLSQARHNVLICAPFIKKAALRVLMDVVQDNVRVSVITRWRPDEIARGVSDLSAFEIIRERPNSEMRILDRLHAKLYVGDRECLMGSANVTLSALGWSSTPNVELLSYVDYEDRSVQSLIRRVAVAPRATYQMQQEVAEAAERYEISNLTSASTENLSDQEIATLSEPWMPKCSAPGKLYSVYKDSNTKVITEDTKRDAEDDLRAISPPNGLNEGEFKDYIANAIREFPSLAKILERIPGRLSDGDAIDLVQVLHPDLSADLAKKQWTIIRDWIDVFLSDQYEVAPQSFVVRLKT